MKVKVYKIRENAKIPVRAHRPDAGMDIFFNPEKETVISIPPGASAILETGIKMEVPEGHMIQIMNKSGIASKRQLVVGACVIDRGYNGEIFINLQNIGTKTQALESGSKIAQAVCVPISCPEVQLISEDAIYDSPTSRGAGGFGSTGDS